MGSTVLITGATGFIATHIIDLLIKEGYDVIGTVRSVDKGEQIQKLFGKEHFKYVIVKDLVNSKDDFNKVFIENPNIETVIHTASAVFITDKIQELIVDPAVKGTENILDTIKTHGGNVKSFVYTSSIGAIITPSSDQMGITRDESTWNVATWDQSKFHPLTGYMFAKTQAERAVWKFAEENKNIRVASVNPSYVFGPQVSNEFVKKTLNSSNEVINTLLRDGENYVKTTAHWVDVRDVAKAHLYAFTKENTKNKRLIMKEGEMTEQTILDIINSKFPQLYGKIARGEPGSDVEIWEKKNLLDNTKTLEILGFDQISLEKSVVDTVQQILDNKVYEF